MLAREATQSDIQAVYKRLQAAKEQRLVDIQIDQVINMVNNKNRRNTNDTQRLSAGGTTNRTNRVIA